MFAWSSGPICMYIFSAMLRKTIGKKNLGEEFLKVLQSLPETDSGSDKNSDLSED